MKKMIVVWFADFLALWFADAVLEGIAFSDKTALAVTALILALMNAIVKPVLKVLSFPVTLMTFGLFSFVLNGIVLMMAFHLAEGSYVSGLPTAMIAALLVSVIGSIFGADQK